MKSKTKFNWVLDFKEDKPNIVLIRKSSYNAKNVKIYEYHDIRTNLKGPISLSSGIKISYLFLSRDGKLIHDYVEFSAALKMVKILRPYTSIVVLYTVGHNINVWETRKESFLKRDNIDFLKNCKILFPKNL